MTEMNPKVLRKICKDMGLYTTPCVNDMLYLHYKGFKKIESLEEYTDLKVLYLEGNGFTKIEGLSHMSKMRALYLQENCFNVLEGLDQLTQLDSVNLSQNFIPKIQGLKTLTKLNTLLMQRNKLASIESLEGLLECPSLCVLDFQKNKIEDPAVVDLLVKMPNLKVLYLKDNPVVQNIKNYRKTVISKIKTLTYLDDRPVFPEERRTAEAWARGGRDEEKAERRRIKEEEQQKSKRNFEWFGRMVEAAKKEKAAKDEEARENGIAVEEDKTEVNTAEVADTTDEVADQLAQLGSTYSERMGNTSLLEEDKANKAEEEKVKEGACPASVSGPCTAKCGLCSGGKKAEEPVAPKVFVTELEKKETQMREEEKTKMLEDERSSSEEEKRASSSEGSSEDSSPCSSEMGETRAHEGASIAVVDLDEEEGMPDLPDLEEVSAGDMQLAQMTMKRPQSARPKQTNNFMEEEKVAPTEEEDAIDELD